MCNCGCNTCETKGPLLTEGKVKSLLSEGLQYHIDKKIPLFETVYRIGSDKHLSLIREARKMYSRNVIDLCEEDEALIKTHLGEFALYEGVSIPLDLPMLNEAYYEVIANLGDKKTKENLDSFEEVQDFMDKMVKRNAISVDVTKFGKDKEQTIKYNWTGDKWEKESKSDINESYDYDEVAQSEFGMDYDQLGSGEKEWVRDEIDNMSMNEAKMSKEKIERLIYSLENQKDSWHPSSDSKKKAMLDKLKKDLSRLNEIDNMSMNESDSNYPDFDLNKNIRYQDTSISSGMWRYTGKEQGGKGVYRNLNNGQILGFDRSDFDIFRNNLSSHFDISESLNESKIPTQDQVDKFFALTQNEMHYLNSKPVMGQEKTFNKMEVEPWDEYDLSNWNALVRKAKSKGQLNEADDKLLKIKQELEALRPGTISWIDDIFISSYDGSLQVELDYTLYPDEIKQLAQIAAKYGMELKYMTGKNATLVKRRIDEAIKKALSEKEGVPHYTKDGKEWKGKVHKMPDGSLMSGNPHDKNGSGPNGESEKLYHKEDLKEDRKYNQEELLRLDLIARRKFDCDYEKCTDEQKAEVLKDKIKVGVKEALQEAKKEIDEAEFKGKKVALGKPKRGGPKAYYVYVKDGDKVKKVTFGSGGLRAKIKNKEARNAFAARHNCKDKKDRTKAGYWSCNLPRYAPASRIRC